MIDDPKIGMSIPQIKKEKYMKLTTGDKIGIPIILVCLAVLCLGPFVLLSIPPGDKEYKDKAFNQTRHLFFLKENSLYDGRMLLELKGKIALTRKQEDKIENLMLKHEAFSIRNSAEIKIKELQFAAYLKTNKVDRKEMETYIQEISREKTDLIIHYLNYLLDLKGLLTPQQLQILKEIKNQDKKSSYRK
jgi:hypothetical protein